MYKGPYFPPPGGGDREVVGEENQVGKKERGGEEVKEITRKWKRKVLEKKHASRAVQ